MEWIVANARNRDVERQHLNKILADIKKTIASSTGSSTPQQVVNTVTISGKPREATVTLTGVVTGQGKGTTGISIETEFATPVVEESPVDGHYYWRLNNTWQPVPPAVLAMDYLPNSGFMSWDFDEATFNAREILGTTGEIDVANGTGVAGDPVVSLADLADTNTGTFKLIQRDAKGRLSGTADGTTDNVPEGTSNLYFTGERAQDAIGDAITVGTGDGVTLSYDDATNSISAVNTDKGSDAVAAHVLETNPHQQYTTYPATMARIFLGA